MDIRQAIVTKYHGPGNVRGARVSASAQAGRIYLDWDDELGRDENHHAAAMAFMRKAGWDAHARIVGGALPDGSYCWAQESTK